MITNKNTQDFDTWFAQFEEDDLQVLLTDFFPQLCNKEEEKRGNNHKKSVRLFATSEKDHRHHSAEIQFITPRRSRRS